MNSPKGTGHGKVFLKSCTYIIIIYIFFSPCCGHFVQNGNNCVYGKLQMLHFSDIKRVFFILVTIIMLIIIICKIVNKYIFAYMHMYIL